MPGNTYLRISFFLKICLLYLIAYFNNIKLLPVDFFRSEEEQWQRFKEGKSQCDGKKKKSKHQDRLAFDFYIVKNGMLILERNSDYEFLGKIWKMLGGTWGGDFSFNDIYHFEV